MKVLLYQEFQGQGSGKKDGLVWCVLRETDEGKRVDAHCLKADTKEQAVIEAANLLKIEPNEIVFE